MIYSNFGLKLFYQILIVKRKLSGEACSSYRTFINVVPSFGTVVYNVSYIVSWKKIICVWLFINGLAFKCLDRNTIPYARMNILHF